MTAIFKAADALLLSKRKMKSFYSESIDFLIEANNFDNIFELVQSRLSKRKNETIQLTRVSH